MKAGFSLAKYKAATALVMVGQPRLAQEMLNMTPPSTIEELEQEIEVIEEFLDHEILRCLKPVGNA